MLQCCCQKHMLQSTAEQYRSCCSGLKKKLICTHLFAQLQLWWNLRYLIKCFYELNAFCEIPGENWRCSVMLIALSFVYKCNLVLVLSINQMSMCKTINSLLCFFFFRFVLFYVPYCLFTSSYEHLIPPSPPKNKTISCILVLSRTTKPAPHLDG